MPKPKFVELILPQDKLPTHDLAGYSICSDYMGDGGRHLFLRKPESVTPPKERKKSRIEREARTSKEREKATPVTLKSERSEKTQTGFTEQDIA